MFLDFFQLFLGSIWGFLITKFLAGKRPGEKGKMFSIILKLKNYQLHLHHWLIGIGLFFTNLQLNFLPLPYFSNGFLVGLIVQGLTYPDWYLIIKRVKS
jgi:hypothetical protein